jgi:hypothetical protein
LREQWGKRSLWSGRHPGGRKPAQQRTHAPQQNGPLFDHLVGALLQGQGHIETERLGRLQIDDKIELGRQLMVSSRLLPHLGRPSIAPALMIRMYRV